MTIDGFENKTKELKMKWIVFFVDEFGEIKQAWCFTSYQNAVAFLEEKREQYDKEFIFNYDEDELVLEDDSYFKIVQANN